MSAPPHTDPPAPEPGSPSGPLVGPPPDPPTGPAPRSAARRALSWLRMDREFAIRWLKVTASATIAWLLASLAFPHSLTIYAPITACFVAFVTVRASFQDAAQRVVAVIAGIGIAYFIGSTFGLTVWTVVTVVALGVLLGQVMRLQLGAANQVPISGLLIMTIGTTPGHVGERIVETLIGAGVSVIVNWLIFPPNHVAGARRAVVEVIEEVSAVLAQMADGISSRWVREDAAEWLHRARAIGGRAAAAEEAVESGADSLRLRPRGADLAEEQDRIGAAMDVIQVVEVQVRVLARTLRDTADALAEEKQTLPPIRMGARVLTAAAGAIYAYSAAALGQTPTEREAGRAEVLTLIADGRRTLAEINNDLVDMTAANLARGLHLGALVVETARVLDELEAGLPVEGGPSPKTGAFSYFRR
ncbi:hypothetical protein D1871_12095 [Nakamurella silvestris]|nr:hypothetical protein D1871_12095 [Nakamurella silvestris]